MVLLHLDVVNLSKCTIWLNITTSNREHPQNPLDRGVWWVMAWVQYRRRKPATPHPSINPTFLITRICLGAASWNGVSTSNYTQGGDPTFLKFRVCKGRGGGGGGGRPSPKHLVKTGNNYYRWQLQSGLNNSKLHHRATQQQQWN